MLTHPDYLVSPEGDKSLSEFVCKEKNKPFNKDEAKTILSEGVKQLRKIQPQLYAGNQYSVLLIFQAMDAAGKDGTVKHVMSGVNPQGCVIRNFKQPSTEELDHDYLWRCAKVLPSRGMIGIFNRSYYEEVLVVRVHPSYLKNQMVPQAMKSDAPGKAFWKQRFEDIRNFESYLTHNQTVILKFFLYVSREEQKARFLDRINEPEKNWKFSMGDIQERGHWDDYMHAYDEMLRHTSREHAPWYVIPADQKWYMRAVVMDIIVNRLSALDLAYPKLNDAHKADLLKAKARLENEA